jgi:hypothetical protein
MDILYRISHTPFLQSNNSLCLLVSEEKTLKISANQKQKLPMVTIFLGSNLDEMRKSYRGPSIDASCKILLYLAKLLKRRRFLEIDQQELPMAVMLVNRSGQNEQSL